MVDMPGMNISFDFPSGILTFYCNKFSSLAVVSFASSPRKWAYSPVFFLVFLLPGAPIVRTCLSRVADTGTLATLGQAGWALGSHSSPDSRTNLPAE